MRRKRSTTAVLSQGIVLALTPALSLSAQAQTGGAPPGTATTGGTFDRSTLLAQDVTPRGQTSTILPTDVLPLPTAQERMSFGENLQLRILQRLPARLYFNSSCETSFRYETNVFQFPTKRKLLTQLPGPATMRLLSQRDQASIIETINLASANDVVFRVLPNVTAGWTLTPRTRLFGNYFMIRDSLFHWIRLNTVIQSVSFGLQQDIPIGRRGNLQAEFQCRELYQFRQQPVFDFLPALTFSYILTPRTVVFVNTLLQLRGKRYFQAPTREIDPFYTVGMLHQRGGWAFSATGTFVQNFREPFHKYATIPKNNYSWILDFEIARRIIKQVPGLQAFARAEPIYNFHSHSRPGLAGMDFRMFFGMRMAFGKPPLTAALEQIRQQLEEQEGTPPPAEPPGKPGEAKPSAYVMPYQLIASTHQPIHDFINPDTFEVPWEWKKPDVVSAILDGGQPARPKQIASSISIASGVQKLPQEVVSGSPVVAMAVYRHNKELCSTVRTGDSADSPGSDLSGRRESAPRASEAQATIDSSQSSSPAQLASAEKKRGPVTMIVVPPFPAVNTQSKQPFAGTGLDVTPPVMHSVVH